jgi:hypothetical protein
MIVACVQRGHKCRSHGDPEMRLLIETRPAPFSPAPAPLTRHEERPRAALWRAGDHRGFAAGEAASQNANAFAAVRVL